jgi:hypothetical protein
MNIIWHLFAGESHQVVKITVTNCNPPVQVSNSAMTKCSVCRTQSQTYCALFRSANQELHLHGNTVCSPSLRNLLKKI